VLGLRLRQGRLDAQQLDPRGAPLVESALYPVSLRGERREIVVQGVQHAGGREHAHVGARDARDELHRCRRRPRLRQPGTGLGAPDSGSPSAAVEHQPAEVESALEQRAVEVGKRTHVQLMQGEDEHGLLEPRHRGAGAELREPLSGGLADLRRCFVCGRPGRLHRRVRLECQGHGAIQRERGARIGRTLGVDPGAQGQRQHRRGERGAGMKRDYHRRASD
jgi:hypothetical protein